jgi:hypothetical protein
MLQFAPVLVDGREEMASRDSFRIAAEDYTNRAWAYRAGEDPLERDQAKWEYAAEECAGRLRAEAALRVITEAIRTQAEGSAPLRDVMLGAMRQANKILDGGSPSKPRPQ